MQPPKKKKQKGAEGLTLAEILEIARGPLSVKEWRKLKGK